MPACLHRLALLDLETTGLSPVTDRITEIGVVLLDHGQVTHCWSSLINPEQAIPPEIQWLTGLSAERLGRAPRFAQVWPMLSRLLAGRILVAHNARFDHGFLKAELRRIGERHFTEVLCTAQLSRRLHPESGSHGLDALCLRHGLESRAQTLAEQHAAHCERTQRHSALGDALRLGAFMQVLEHTQRADHLKQSIEALLRRPACPPHLDPAMLETLPDDPGVYVFRGAGGQPLYVGKAKNLSDRIRGHFHADSRLAIDARLSAQTHAIEVQPTAGEFSALILEAQWVKALNPLHNQRLRKTPGARFIALPGPGLAPRLISLADLLHQGPSPAHWPAGLYGPFTSAAAARSTLSHLGRVHGLCDAGIGLWHRGRVDAPAPCFSHQVGRCPGLCTGDESAASHHQRLLAALHPLRLPAWPLKDRWSFEETDPQTGRRASLEFFDWCPVTVQDGAGENGAPHIPNFDPDIYRMLRRRIGDSPHSQQACDFPETALA